VEERSLFSQSRKSSCFEGRSKSVIRSAFILHDKVGDRLNNR